MLLMALTSVLFTALLFSYFSMICGEILRRKFDGEYSQVVAEANQLGFPSVQKSLEESGAPIDYSRVRRTLNCDFLTLTYLLKNAVNFNQRYSAEERLLIVYFRLAYLYLSISYLIHLREVATVQRLTAVLQYFANVVGRRINALRVADLTTSDFLLGIQ